MKKKQILITGNIFNEWSYRVNNHLKDGWMAVPHTLKLSASVDFTKWPPAYSNAYAVVLEIEEYKE